MQQFVLPEWWDDELADLEANRALAEVYIARQLGFRVEELRERDRALSLPAMQEVRFKRFRNEIDNKVRTSALVAQRAARAVARTIGDNLDPYARQQEALKIREAILRQSRYVDLESLLQYCWEAGIIVMQLAHRPAKSKGFDGMAGFFDQRPVIVLASGRDGPPWLAFHLAHELGHIMLSHVNPETGSLFDGTLTSETGSSAHEREADQFACELLSGVAGPTIADLKATAPRLAVIAARSGPAQGVDPGVFALIYARSNHRWPVAQEALKHLGLESGGQATVAKFLERHLALAESSEDDQRFLNVLNVA